MSKVEVKVPNYASLILQELDKLEQDVAKKIVTEAKIRANDLIYTGARPYTLTRNYINSIEAKGNLAIAGAIYSSMLEFESNQYSGSSPYAIMRNSARQIAKDIGGSFR